VPVLFVGVCTTSVRMTRCTHAEVAAHTGRFSKQYGLRRAKQ
jgi:hypothetical protein